MQRRPQRAQGCVASQEHLLGEREAPVALQLVSPSVREMNLKVVPLELDEANEFVRRYHRHHQPTKFHRFSIGAVDADGVLRSAAIIMKPVARLAGNQREVLEVSRLVSDGTKNACSILYAAAARAGKELGYCRIQTYILEDEPGTTLKASGWIDEGPAGGGQWEHTDGKPRRTDQPNGGKRRWAKALNVPSLVVMPWSAEIAEEGLWADLLPLLKVAK